MAHAISGVGVVCLLLTQFSLASTSGAGSDRTSALYSAARNGELVQVRELVQQGADCNAIPENDKPKWGYLVQTPMELAATEGHADVVAVLLECGARPRWDRWYGMYAATWASAKQHKTVVQVLLENAPSGIDLNAWFGPAMLQSCLKGFTEILDLLLAAGIDPNWHTPGDHFPNSCLVEAARGNKLELFELLLDSGADPNGKSHRGEGGPLLNASQQLRADLVSLLLERGANPHVESANGNAISMATVTYTRQRPETQRKVNQTVKVLLDADVDVNQPFKGRSPLWYARKHHNEELAQMLEAAGGREFETLGRKLRKGVMGLLYMIGSH